MGCTSSSSERVQVNSPPAPTVAPVEPPAPKPEPAPAIATTVLRAEPAPAAAASVALALAAAQAEVSAQRDVAQQLRAEAALAEEARLDAKWNVSGQSVYSCAGRLPRNFLETTTA